MTHRKTVDTETKGVYDFEVTKTKRGFNIMKSLFKGVKDSLKCEDGYHNWKVTDVKANAATGVVVTTYTCTRCGKKKQETSPKT